jgi:hypothetical protein
MSALTDRLERDLGELAAGAQPSPSAWEAIAARLDDDGVSEVVVVLAPARHRSKRPAWIMTAAALVVIAASVAVFVLTTRAPKPSVDLPNHTKTFVSPRNGFSIKYSGEMAITPADDVWDPGNEHGDVGVDVMDTRLGVIFRGASMPIIWEDAVSVDQWVDDYVLHGHCGAPRGQQEEITIDGNSGRVAECAGGVVATLVAGGRVYLFTLSDEGSDARAVFDAFAATIELTWRTAYAFPKLATTFDSPSYGFSVDYPSRAAITPATEPWGPGGQELAVDGIETGLAAFFEGASIKIPDGVSIDQWVDDDVLRGGCGTPRGQQAQITIDGRPGRISECAGEVTATVVAGGRLYLFSLLHGGRLDARAVFDAFAATIVLTPETARA